MPWKLIEDTDADGNKTYCLEKEDTGERVDGSCHSDKAETEAMMRAMYANVKESVSPDEAVQEFVEYTPETFPNIPSQICEIRISDLKGTYPDIPYAPGVDYDALVEGDGKPFFMTLPIAETGVVSANKLRYTETLCRSLAEQINSDKATGIRGHIKEEDRGTSYPSPHVYWVGARFVANEPNVDPNWIGKTWAKAYIPPGETREEYRIKKALNAQAATSIYGTPKLIHQHGDGTYTPVLSLEQVDLAPPKRAATGRGYAFAVTHEMSSNGENTMPLTREQLSEVSPADLYELLDENAAAAIAEQWAKKKNKKVVAAEMVADAGRIAEFETVTTERDRLLRENKQLGDRVAEYAREEFAAGLQGVIEGAFASWQNLDKLDAKQQQQFSAVKAQLQSRVIAELDGRQDLGLAKAKRDAILESDEFRPVVELMRDAFTGGSVITGGKTNAREDLYKRGETAAAEVMGVSNG